MCRDGHALPANQTPPDALSFSIKLNHIASIAIAVITYRQRGEGRAIRLYDKMIIGEAGVRQAVAEREQDLLSCAGKPAIADIGAFIISDREGGWTSLRERWSHWQGGTRQVVFREREAERQMARRIDIAEQDLGDGLATGNAGYQA